MSCYTDARIPRLVPNLEHAPEVLVAEVARLLSPWKLAHLDEGDVIEAFATFLLDTGVADAAPRFVLYASGFSHGFLGQRGSASGDTEQERTGHRHGWMARILHSEWRRS